MKILKIFLIVFSFLTIVMPQGFSEEDVDTFIIRIFPTYVQVLSPSKVEGILSLVFENKTLSKILGKIVNPKGQVISFVTINASSYKSIELKVESNDKFFFMPFSPAFQEVPLKIGSKSYEIPSQD